MIWPYFLVVPAYFIGMIPFAVFVGRISGHDIYKEGSGNPGASNVARVAGWKWGLLAMLLDVLKGFVPTLLAVIYVNDHLPDESARLVSYLVGAAAICGHVVPIGRKGGKGIATGGGVALALFPIGGIVILIVWAIVIKTTKLPVVASLVAVTLLMVYVGFDHQYWWEFTVVALFFVIAVVRHIPNIRRLINGHESAITKEARHQYQEKTNQDDE